MIIRFLDAYRQFRLRHAKVLRFFLPVVSLASGFAGVVLFRRGILFAPVAAASVLLAWTAGAAIRRWLPEKEDAGRVRRVARWLAGSFVAGLYQDALFFSLPVWFGSATWPSINIIVPLLLGAMAIFSCFEELYLKYVLERAAVRAAFSAVVLFSTMVAAIPVLLNVPLRPSLALSATFSTLLASIATIPLERLRTRKTMSRIGVAAVLSGGLMILIAPVLPPVPVQCMSSVVARAIEEKEPVEPAKTFPAGLPRIYAHFAVAAPPSFTERVRFRWIHDGRALGKEFETEITGGRRTGFRTWGYTSTPKAGRWVVELYAESGQLVGRERFRVEASTTD